MLIFLGKAHPINLSLSIYFEVEAFSILRHEGLKYRLLALYAILMKVRRLRQASLRKPYKIAWPLLLKGMLILITGVYFKEGVRNLLINMP